MRLGILGLVVLAAACGKDADSNEQGHDASDGPSGKIPFAHSGESEVGDPGCLAITMTAEGFQSSAEVDVTWATDQDGKFYADDGCSTELAANKSKIAADANSTTVYYASETAGDHTVTATASSDEIDEGTAILEHPGYCVGVPDPVTTKSNVTASKDFDASLLERLNDAAATSDGTWFRTEDDAGNLIAHSFILLLNPATTAAEFSLGFAWTPTAAVPTLATGERVYGKSSEQFNVYFQGSANPFWGFTSQKLHIDKVPTADDPAFAVGFKAIVTELIGGETTPSDGSPRHCVKAFIKGTMSNTQD